MQPETWLMTAATGSIAHTSRKEPLVHAVASQSEKLRELDLGTSQAWQLYSERLNGLAGQEYERAEAECWDQLQRELRRIERKRKLLAGVTA